MKENQPRVKGRNREKRATRERYSYIVLAVIAMMLAGFSVLYSNREAAQTTSENNHKFCQLMVASLTGQPVPKKPADPQKHVAQARLYRNYLIVSNLSHNLGCS